MEKNLNEQVSRIKSMMKMVNEHEFDFEEPKRINTSVSLRGRPVRIIKSYNSVKELKNDFDKIESMSTGLSFAALALIDDMSKDDNLPFHLVKNSKGEYQVCYDSELYNSNRDRDDWTDTDEGDFNDEFGDF